MNTVITLTVIKTPSDSTAEITDAIEDGFGEFERIVKQYTRFQPTSELSLMNAQAGKWFEVTPEFFMLIERMLELSQATAGAFDPTVIDFLETYGYDPNYDFSKLDNPDLDQHIAKIVTDRASWRDIELDKSNLKVKLRPGQRIDLGGIGKGYAIDCAYEKLNRFGNVLIDAGGDLRVKGRNDCDQPWQLGLVHNHNDQKVTIGRIESDGIALASSGSWARKVKQFHHIIDPHTGQPTQTLKTAFITADDAATADSWATAVFVDQTLAEKLPKGIEALLIDVHDQAKSTPGFKFQS